MRPTLIALTATLVLGLGAAHAQPVLDLGAATALAVEAAADVRSARLDLTSAERDLARLAADPTTLRVPRLQAEHAVDRARTALAGAELAAADAAAGAYEGALEADDRLALAEGARDLAATALQAARIQFDAGAATRLDVERAENDLQSAERDVVDAQAARTLAYDRLASLLAISADELALAPAPTPLPVAPLEAVLEGLEANAQLLAAAQQVALATAQLAAIDNPLSSARADVAAARDRVETAQLLLDEQRRNLVLFVRQAHNAALAAEARVRGAEANLATAREDVQVQQVRFDAGSISALVLARAQQQVAIQEANLAIAQHALAAAVRQVELTVAGTR